MMFHFHKCKIFSKILNFEMCVFVIFLHLFFLFTASNFCFKTKLQKLWEKKISTNEKKNKIKKLKKHEKIQKQNE